MGWDRGGGGGQRERERERERETDRQTDRQRGGEWGWGSCGGGLGDPGWEKETEVARDTHRLSCIEPNQVQSEESCLADNSPEISFAFAPQRSVD